MGEDQMSEETTPTGDTGGRSMLASPFFWGALTIMLIWTAVLFIGVFADTHFRADFAGDHVEVPVVWGIGLLAFLGTWVVAAHSFKSRD
jgi:hypothetical protein